jgi:hypothetical protein
MVIETEILPFWQWLLHGSSDRLGALPSFCIVIASLAILALLAGLLVTAFRHGPMQAGDIVYKVVRTAIGEVLAISPRRVMALAYLAVKESLGRRVWVAVALFLVILLFANWFLGTDNPDPTKLYISFVLTATTYLVLLMALFLSAFSLPTDIKNKTIHTIVTKPVRAGEIVLGRIVGFVAVGTVMLAVMGGSSYLFVVRALNHRHDVDIFSLVDSEGAEGKTVRRGRTTLVQQHRHDLVIDQGGSGEALNSRGHWHAITPEQRGDETHFAVGPPRDMFRARVPVLGKLRFKGPKGASVAKGISVGNEWAYRSYIEGGTLAAAIWTFEGINAEAYPVDLPLELTVSIFRTHKGDIEKGVLGSVVVKNPNNPNFASVPTLFQAKEFTVNSLPIPRQLTDVEGKPLDLLNDLVHDGKVEIWVQCLETGQYFGMAQADCYLQAREGSFVVNFFKGYLGIWVQMFLVTCFGVMCSTFLSGPVAMVFTLAIIVVGFFKKFLLGLTAGTVVGGGPVEALVRLVTQQNVTAPLEAGGGVTAIKDIDAVLLIVMRGFANVLPDFRSFSTVGFVADGYDVSWNFVAQDLVAGLAYLAGLYVVGYLFLRTREVAK